MRFATVPSQFLKGGGSVDPAASFVAVEAPTSGAAVSIPAYLGTKDTNPDSHVVTVKNLGPGDVQLTVNGGTIEGTRTPRRIPAGGSVTIGSVPRPGATDGAAIEYGLIQALLP